MQALLDRLEPTPAVLLNQLSDILAYTAGYERLARPVGLLDAAAPNLARFIFTDSRARSAYPDWEHLADEQVEAVTRHLRISTAREAVGDVARKFGRRHAGAQP